MELGTSKSVLINLIPKFTSTWRVNPLDYSSHLIAASKIIIASYEDCTPAVHVLNYMIEFSKSGLYYAGKGKRSILLQRLRMSRSSYERSIERLRRLGLIIKLKNDSGSKYVSYGFHEELVKIANGGKDSEFINIIISILAPVNDEDRQLMVCKIMIALCSKETPVDKVLANILIKGVQDYLSSYRKGGRSGLLEKYAISKSSFERALKYLKQLDLLMKYGSGGGGPYNYYQLSEECIDIVKSWQKNCNLTSELMLQRPKQEL